MTPVLGAARRDGKVVVTGPPVRYRGATMTGSKPRYYSTTYEIVTEESARDGDFAEHGFVLHGGYDLPIEDGCIGHEFTQWVDRMGVNQHLDGAPDDPDDYSYLTDLVRLFGGGIHVNGTELREDGDAEQDMRTGAYRSERMWFVGLTEAEVAALRSVIGRR